MKECEICGGRRMSYDLAIAVKIDGTELFKDVEYPIYDSPTYNLGTMFRKATGWDFKQGKYYKCSEVIENIEQGIRELRMYPEKYKKYEAENGWGTIKSAIRDLESLRDCIYETAEDIPIKHLWVTW